MIWITQCLCERRHCMMAGAWNDAEMAREQGIRKTRETITGMIERGLIDSRCPICQSSKFHYETARTKWQTLEEATAALAASEAMQRGTGDLLAQMNAATKH
jgi:hypothetical protein